MGQVASAARPAVHTVMIEGTQFQPGELTVKIGDSIEWVNNDPFPHTVTSKTGGFDSRQIQPGKSWKYRAVKKGEFPYICSLHPTMQATLRVR
jgi:plastocyanin